MNGEVPVLLPRSFLCFVQVLSLGRDLLVFWLRGGRALFALARTQQNKDVLLRWRIFYARVAENKIVCSINFLQGLWDFFFS